MSEEKKEAVTTIAVEESVRDDLKILAAVKKVSIKNYLKEMVEKEKNRDSEPKSGLIETIIAGGKSFDVSGETGIVDWDNLEKYPAKTWNEKTERWE